MAPRKPVSAPPSGGGLKDLLSPRSPLEAAQSPVILKGAPGGSPETAGNHARGREDVADKQTPENGKPKPKAVGRETLKGAYNVESKASNKEHGSHEAGSGGKESLPESKEDEDAEGDRNKKLKSAQLKELGNAHFAKNDFQSAAEYYTQALEFDSENAVLYANRAQSRLNQGQSVSALDDANHAVTLNPSWWKAHAKRAQACLALGQFRSAVGSFEEALKLQPNDVGLKKGLSEAKAGVSCLKGNSMQFFFV
jgi:tetratricopeptide (TPR) repeat protein